MSAAVIAGTCGAASHEKESDGRVEIVWHSSPTDQVILAGGGDWPMLPEQSELYLSSVQLQWEDGTIDEPKLPIHRTSTTEPSLGQIDWRALHEQYIGWDVDVMLRIAGCESAGDPNAIPNPDAISPPDSDGLRNYGAHQHHGDPFAAGHPEYSTHQAYLKWQDRGYQPWVGSQGCWQ